MKRFRARRGIVRACALGLPVMLFSGVLLVPSAFAKCNLINPNYVPEDIKINFGNILIKPGLAVGDEIARFQKVVNVVPNAAICPVAGNYVDEYVSQRKEYLSKVYETNVYGVGIRVIRSGAYMNVVGPYQRAAIGGNGNGGTFTAVLIKINNETGSGVIAPAGPYVRSYFDGDGAGRPFLTGSIGADNAIYTSTCLVKPDSKDIKVGLPRVAAQSFQGVGNRILARDFAVNLSCQGGRNGEYQGQIGLRIDADKHSSGRAGVLVPAAGADTAQGVSLELSKRNPDGSENALVFGGSILLGSTTPTMQDFSLPLRVRYIQTEPVVRGGRLDAVATFTIDYR